MDEDSLWALIVAAAAGLDLWLAAVRACVLRLSLKDLTRLRKTDSEVFHRLIDLLRQRDLLRLVVQGGMLITHFFIAMGAFYFALRRHGSAWPPPGDVLAILVGVALALGVAEWLLDVTLRGKTAAVRWAVPWAERLVKAIAPLQRLFGSRGEADWLLNDDTFQAILQANLQEGRLEQEERAMLRSIVRFGDTVAREIMVPRIDMVAVELHTPLDATTDLFIESGFSRLPVYEKKIDNIVGLVYAKDLLPIWRAGMEDKRTLRQLVREAYFVPEAKKVDDLLAEMQQRRIHMALVVDEYGGIAGLVTLEDIVEEIIGEIQDEYDLGEETAEIRFLGNGEYLVSGRVDLDDLNDALGAHFPTDEVDTLGGLLFSVIGHMPVEGEQVQIGDYLFTIDKVEQRRILWVRARRLPAASPNPSAEDASLPPGNDAPDA